MSTLSVTNLKNAASATNNLVLNPDGSVNISGGTLSSQSGMRNRIINGAMTIDQRNAGASVTVSTTSGVFPVDRFVGLASDVTGTFTLQQSSTVPAGFKNAIIATVGTTFTPSGSNQYNIRHNIEGLNVSDLGWGTASAQTVTLSFWVRSSVTGTYGGSLTNSAFDRSYPFTFAISAANTYEYKTITIAGDTSGTWLTTNGIGIRLCISLGAGSTLQGTAGAWAAGAFTSATGATNWISNAGATFFLTGVQLEKGSTATPFEFRSIGTELGLCQRYAIGFPFGSVSAKPTIAVGGSGLYFDANIVSCSMNGSNLFNMRTVPTTITSIGTQGTDWGFQTSAGVTQTGFTLSTNHGLVAGDKTSHGLGANSVSLRVLTSAGNIIISSEL